jgi:hypothetical protein
LCTLKSRKYRWEAVTVPVGQLAKDPSQRRECTKQDGKAQEAKSAAPAVGSE